MRPQDNSPYIMPFSQIKRKFYLSNAEDQTSVVHNFSDVLDMVKYLLLPVKVDEGWYFSEYPDVAAAVQKKSNFNSASHHFITVGYFESRLPFARDAGQISHPLSFRAVKAMLTAIPERRGLRFEITNAGIRELIRTFLNAVWVDEEWYLKSYPDIAAAIAAGHFHSGKEHFVGSGYFEGRWPFDIPVDEDWYTATYTDVPTSGTVHFQKFGYWEGRLPRYDALSNIIPIDRSRRS